MAKTKTYVDFQRCGTCAHFIGNKGNCRSSGSRDYWCPDWTDKYNPRGYGLIAKSTPPKDDDESWQL